MSQVTNKQVVTFQLCMEEMSSTREQNKASGGSIFTILNRTRVKGEMKNVFLISE